MSGFAIRIPQYEGPLDLLVSLVRREDLSITDLPLAPIAAQYLAYIEQAAALDVNLGMEWIELAARLIHWKSASLLPADPSLPDPGIELRQELARGLQSIAGPRSWSNPDSGLVLVDPALGDEIPASLWTLRDKARRLVKTFEARRCEVEEAYAIEADPVSVEEMRVFVFGALDRTPPGVWVSSADWLEPDAPKVMKICLLLALLDIAAAGVVRLDEDSGAESVRVLRL